MAPIFSKSAPPKCKGNPGAGTSVRTAFSNGGRTWTEEADLVELAATTLTKNGYAVERRRGWLRHAESGFAIVPQIVTFEPLEDGGVQTVTTIEVHHPTLAPGGVFEYQHATGDNLPGAISEGFKQWMDLDFVTLLDALRPNATSCAVMEMTFPESDGRRARTRRAVLGPVAHLQEKTPVEVGRVDPDDHSFCPCCLLMSSFDAFRTLIEGDETHCVRLFAQRLGDGSPGSDCRVNGEDWEPGAEALREYARSWPAAGIEFRKQLVILQTVGA